MEYNITTIEKAKETLEKIEKKWKNIELEENIKIERKNIAQIKTVYNW